MSEYYHQTVIQQLIPDADMTPLERLLLSNIFTAERDDDGWYFFAEENPCVMITVTRRELEQALAASPDDGSAARACVAEQLAASETGAAEIDLDISDASLDLSGTSFEFFLQDIVRRSKTLKYISVVTSFTCSRMRPDGFGGMAVLITPDAIVGKTTGDFLEDMIAEAGLDDETPACRVEAQRRRGTDIGADAPAARQE
jgi:hypothetical protein